jgi:hypothetical protein
MGVRFIGGKKLDHPEKTTDFTTIAVNSNPAYWEMYFI